jgi:hypothetical protein
MDIQAAGYPLNFPYPYIQVPLGGIQKVAEISATFLFFQVKIAYMMREVSIEDVTNFGWQITAVDMV